MYHGSLSHRAMILASLLVAACEPRAEVPLYTDLGTLHKAITTRSAKAQQYFDQGLRLTYGFNHGEAIRAYQEALRFDPACAMCQWGVAYALGPNINAGMDTAAERQAYTAIEQAKQLAPKATAAEQAYLIALAKRYSATPGEGRAARDSAYAQAMAQLAKEFPQDVDAQVLYAEAMMDLRPWALFSAEGKAAPGTDQIIATLEAALRAAPDHPGACHYYIHAVEASVTPERAVPCAERLAALMPGAGHLVHMPAHIYMRVGRYADAVTANQHAAHTDERFITDRNPSDLYPFTYYPHNLHFLWIAAATEGRSAEAIEAARQLSAQLPDSVVRAAPQTEIWMPSTQFALARFNRWAEILQQPVPAAEFKYARGISHYARGLALSATGDAKGAATQLDSLKVTIAQADTTRPEVQYTLPLLKIAESVLTGGIHGRAGHHDLAIRSLREAVALEDQLPFDEPPRWYFPVRQALGAALLAAGKTQDAERVYREDLARNRENGWALFGLTKSLEARHAGAAGDSVRKRFDQAWTRADVKLASSVAVAM